MNISERIASWAFRLADRSPRGPTSTRAILCLGLPPGIVLPCAAILAVTTCDTGHGRKSSGPRLTSRQGVISESQDFLSLDVPVSSAIIAANPAALGLSRFGPGRPGGGHRIACGRTQGDNRRGRTSTTSTSRRDGTCQGTQTRPQLAADRRSPHPGALPGPASPPRVPS